VFRVQQNNLEYLILYFPAQWLSCLFVDPRLAMIPGLIFAYGRYQYGKGYSEDASKRGQGFYMSANALRVFLVLLAYGLVRSLYANFQ